MTARLPLAFYGTLRPGGGGLGILGIGPKMRRIGPGILRGRLFDQDGLPAFVEGDGTVAADLFAPPDKATQWLINEWEDYEPHNPIGSLYVQKRVRLLQPAHDALVYVWNRPLNGAAAVPDGDWLRWVARDD